MRMVVGTMTGTSMDGVDAVAVEIEGYGLEMQTTFHSIASSSLADIQEELQNLASQDSPQYDRALALRIGHITASTIQALNLQTIDLIALHGQTIYHKPPYSMQLIDPKPVISMFDCPILNDPRQADLALGGQGAPVTPLADWVMFRSVEQSTAVVNLGGFCNITLLPACCTIDDIKGFDLCCCNLILDTIARDRLHEPYDTYGQTACAGIVNDEFANWLISTLQTQHVEGRSLGTGDNIGHQVSQEGKHLSTADILATATYSIGEVISDCTKDVQRILLAGGGAYNVALQRAIAHHGLVDQSNVPLQAREAMAMAILGVLSIDGISITLPQVTGRQVTDALVGFVQASP